MTPEIQRALLQVWAKDIGHVVDQNTSPKAEFARLAKSKGWTGGGVEWCHYWTKCFNETYSWGVCSRSTPRGSTVDADLAAQASTFDLTDHVRKLSVGSDASSFSVISRTSRADSFNSVISLNSDQSGEDGNLRLSVGPRSHSITKSWESTDSRITVLSLDAVKSPGEISGGIEIPNHDGSIVTDTATENHDTDSEVSLREAVQNPAWNDFTGFMHCPTAPFKKEFERLARIKGWNRRIKRQNLIALLRTEVEFYWGVEDVDKLEYYQYLCQEMGIWHIPSTVTQARKSLRPLKINLYSVIDHMRNPKIEVITYKTIRELRLSVRKMGTFPRECAKAGGGYMAALLSKL